MHLAPRALLLAAFAVLLAVAGMWAGDPRLDGLWRWPLATLLAGLAWEAATRRRQMPRVSLQAPARLYLGRAHPATMRFVHDGRRAQRIEYAPAVPAGFAPLGAPRLLALPPGASTDDPVELLPLRLGEQAWPSLPARRLGRFELAWWSFVLSSGASTQVAPDPEG